MQTILQAHDCPIRTNKYRPIKSVALSNPQISLYNNRTLNHSLKLTSRALLNPALLPRFLPRSTFNTVSTAFDRNRVVEGAQTTLEGSYTIAGLVQIRITLTPYRFSISQKLQLFFITLICYNCNIVSNQSLFSKEFSLVFKSLVSFVK